MRKAIVFFAALFVFAVQGQDIAPPVQVSVTGNGSPILLIPGFAAPGDSWDATVSHLAKNHECHIVTIAGFGGTHPIGFPWLPTVNKAIENYIHTNRLTNLTVIGHSLGGTIGAWLASRENNKITKLILIDALPAAGALMIPNFDPEHLTYDNPFSQQQLAMNEDEFAQMAKSMAQNMSLNREAQSLIEKWIISADRKTFVYGYTDYLKLDLREDLKRITIPVTIIAADQPFGNEMVTENYQKQYANLAKYNLIIADNAAHFVMFDRPQWFLQQIQQILASD